MSWATVANHEAAARRIRNVCFLASRFGGNPIFLIGNFQQILPIVMAEKRSQAGMQHSNVPSYLFFLQVYITTKICNYSPCQNDPQATPEVPMFPYHFHLLRKWKRHQTEVKNGALPTSVHLFCEQYVMVKQVLKYITDNYRTSCGKHKELLLQKNCLCKNFS